MKKIFLIVAVLMLATPALAVDVDLWAEAGDDFNEVEIWYEVYNPAPADCEDGNRPRAFGLNISVDDGNIIDINVPFVGECNANYQGYGIFPGTINIVAGEVSPDGWGEPVAPDDAPGAEGTGLDTNTIVVEMGSLYTGANCPPDSDLLFTITVSRDCNVSIEGNAARTGTASPEGKGVVLENLAEVLVNFPEAPFKVHGVSRYVPDVVGLIQGDAETEIDACDLVVGDISWVCNHTVAYDYVLSQSPEAGTKVDKDTSVDLLKSLGAPHVPDVVNEPNLVAQATIEDVCGLSVGNVTAECNDVIPDGNVISTNPAFCNYPDCGTTVDIVISTGPCEEVDCFPGSPSGNAWPDWNEYDYWVAAGKPDCWCAKSFGEELPEYGYQCKGDADGDFVGKDKLGKRQWVTLADMDIMFAAWQKVDDATWAANPSWICADFAHQFVGKDKDGKRQWVTGCTLHTRSRPH